MAKIFYLNKKGVSAVVGSLAIIVIVIITFSLLAGMFGWFAKESKGKAAEDFCFITNAVNVGILPQKARTLGVELKGCQTIDKQDIPFDEFRSSKYIDRKEGAKAQIAAMIAQCWKNWLEGIRDEDGENEDVFATSYKDTGFDKECFVCNTFSLDKKTGMIGRGELSRYLAGTPYIIHDPSDKCDSGGGGYCHDICPEDFPREIRSKKCTLGQRCCVATDTRDECKNKGGRCEEAWFSQLEPEGEKFWIKYDKWSCRKGSCYIKQENFFSYVDYVQRSKGPGMIVFSKSVVENNLTPGYQYAIVFNEDTTADELIGVTAGAVTGVTLTVAGGVAGTLIASKLIATGGAIGTLITPGIGTVVGLGVGALVGFGLAYTGYEAGKAIAASELVELKEIDQIMIAEVNEVQDHCKIESGV
ncbi:MAG: hypothetical protein KAT77_02135 [Nanoarchaeota archaeon]|nr:hypothetical protein [Nanoarchaeota archaeon]